MAGAYWHYYVANRAVELFEKTLKGNRLYRCILDYRLQFLAGVQGPDFNYFPGGDVSISNLAHGNQPADLGRSFLKNANTDQEKAFAYGWLMHLTTDNIVHPLVNRMILEHFPRQTKNGTDFNVYPLGHHRVEWGIDASLLQNPSITPYLPNLPETLLSAIDLTSLAERALRETFNYELTPDVWQSSINGMIRYMSIFEKAWEITGRLKDRNPIKQALKNWGHFLLVTPLAKLVALRNPENGAGVFIPIVPSPADMEAILAFTEQVGPVFATHLEDGFINLPNDTGQNNLTSFADIFDQ